MLVRAPAFLVGVAFFAPVLFFGVSFALAERCAANAAAWECPDVKMEVRLSIKMEQREN